MTLLVAGFLRLVNRGRAAKLKRQQEDQELINIEIQRIDAYIKILEREGL